jgi:hypothetical protein
MLASRAMSTTRADMLRHLILAAAVCLAACSTTPKIPIDYKGADGGVVVVGIGTTDTWYTSWTLEFRRRGDAAVPKPPSGSFTYEKRELLHGVAPDYENEEDKGIVLVTRLPEGDYEIYATSEYFNSGVSGTALFYSVKPFSIPFTVRRDQPVYLGNYMASPTWGKNLIGLRVRSNAYYTVEDRKDVDLRIAAAKGLGATPAAVRDETPQVTTLNTSIFATPDEHRRREAANR